MLICKVVKPLVSTNRIPDFEHHLQMGLDPFLELIDEPEG